MKFLLLIFTLFLQFNQGCHQPLVTWVFEEGTFVPAAKLTENESFSIVTDYLGTPTNAYKSDGTQIWERKLNSYGGKRAETGGANFVPFRFQGQYFDGETGLCYNRFRYYDPETGNYISQDPIRLNGGHTLYGYVHNTNGWVDISGLSTGSGTLGNRMERAGQTNGVQNFNRSDYRAHHIIPDEVYNDPKNAQLWKDTGFTDKNVAQNGVFLPKSKEVGEREGFNFYHSGPHTNTTRNIDSQVADIRNAYANGDIDKNEAAKLIEELQNEERDRLSQKNGGECQKVS